MSALKIRRVGNSIGVILPKEIQETLNVSEGDEIDVTTVGGNKIVLDSHLPHHSKWVFKDTSFNKEDNQWMDADLEEDHDKAPRW